MFYNIERVLFSSHAMDSSRDFQLWKVGIGQFDGGRLNHLKRCEEDVDPKDEIVAQGGFGPHSEITIDKTSLVISICKNMCCLSMSSIGSNLVRVAMWHGSEDDQNLLFRVIDFGAIGFDDL
jgi:hypothetical protein